MIIFQDMRIFSADHTGLYYIFSFLLLVGHCCFRLPLRRILASNHIFKQTIVVRFMYFNMFGHTDRRSKYNNLLGKNIKKFDHTQSNLFIISIFFFSRILVCSVAITDKQMIQDGSFIFVFINCRNDFVTPVLFQQQADHSLCQAKSICEL